MIAIDTKTKTRRMLVRGILIVAYAGLIMLAFVFGKGHTILLDNKDSEDGTVKAFEEVTVSVDGQEPIDFMSGDRDLAKVRAQAHSIEITINDQKTVKQFRIPLSLETGLLSIPKLVAGIEPALIPFVQADEPAPPVDPNAGNNNQFTSPGGTPEVPEATDAPAPTAP